MPGRSTLAENIKKVRAKILEEVDRELLSRATAAGVEIRAEGLH